MTDYALVYPTDRVTLADLSRAALTLVDPALVTVVSGAGSQALRIPQDAVARTYRAAGLAPDGSPQETSTERASGPEEESPGPDASQPTAAPGRPAGRAAGRPAVKKTAAKKTTARTTRSSKEGDDQ
ncbi:hypothetical protein [Streptomyces longwoodensis]|uniref:hypothetical protein n=1 Tax=Streptomyces longwoodensis TaxID=68231 RepID=UPI0036FA652D